MCGEVLRKGRPVADPWAHGHRRESPTGDVAQRGEASSSIAGARKQAQDSCCQDASGKPALVIFGGGSSDNEAQLGPVRVRWPGAPDRVFQRPRLLLPLHPSYIGQPAAVSMANRAGSSIIDK